MAEWGTACDEQRDGILGYLKDAGAEYYYDLVAFKDHAAGRLSLEHLVNNARSTGERFSQDLPRYEMSLVSVPFLYEARGFRSVRDVARELKIDPIDARKHLDYLSSAGMVMKVLLGSTYHFAGWRNDFLPPEGRLRRTRALNESSTDYEWNEEEAHPLATERLLAPFYACLAAIYERMIAHGRQMYSRGVTQLRSD